MRPWQIHRKNTDERTHLGQSRLGQGRAEYIVGCALLAFAFGAAALLGTNEALTSVLIFVNRAHKVDGAGILVTGDLSPIEDA